MTCTVSQNVLDQVARLAAEASPCETGGVLSGLLFEEETVVEQAFTPPDSIGDDRCFLRGTSGLAAFFEDEWRTGRAYVGEWHSHPAHPPTPSDWDVSQMREYLRQGSLGSLLLVIVGTEDGEERVRAYCVSEDACEEVEVGD